MKIKNLFNKMLGCLRYLWYFGQINTKVNIKHGLDLPNGNKGVKISKYVTLGTHVVLNAFDGGKIIIGEGSYIGNSCRINSTTEVRLGQSVMIADNVYIADVDHQYNNIDLPIIKQGYCTWGGRNKRWRMDRMQCGHFVRGTYRKECSYWSKLFG